MHLRRARPARHVRLPRPVRHEAGTDVLQERAGHVPRYIASVTAEGGIVSTASDTMRFVEACFTGRAFPLETVGMLMAWNRIRFPGQVGIGLEKRQRRDRAALAFRLIGRTAAASSESTRTPRRASCSWDAAPA